MRKAHCTATALIYSGRPDPEWELAHEQLETLKRIWQQLPPSKIAPPSPPPLGYRGAAIRCNSGEEWLAYGNIVTFKRGASRPKHRVDDQRRFEQTLLGAAPLNALPAGFRPPPAP
jgi:hypothetical protein